MQDHIPHNIRSDPSPFPKALRIYFTVLPKELLNGYRTLSGGSYTFLQGFYRVGKDVKATLL